MSERVPPNWPRHKITVDMYHQMIKAGILGENDRVELMRGELVQKTAINEPHCAAVDTLNMLFSEAVRRRALVPVQQPIVFPESEPECDVSLVLQVDEIIGSKA